MWVSIDCRSKNWVAVLKRLGSAALVAISVVSLVSVTTDRLWGPPFLLMGTRGSFLGGTAET
jgi:hypothetical protein